jgi:hypothetical protein
MSDERQDLIERATLEILRDGCLALDTYFELNAEGIDPEEFGENVRAAEARVDEDMAEAL